MSAWDIKTTRYLLVQKYGPAQLGHVRNAIRATTVRLDHAAYHFGELRRLLREHIDEKLVERDLYDFAIPGCDEWSTLQQGLLHVEAHMIACAQSVHAVPDALAHIAFYAAGLNLLPKPLREDKISLKNLLNKRTAQGSSWFEVESSLRMLADDPAFTALDAIVNYNKHRGLPDPALQLEPDDHPGRYAMQFESFSYDGVVQPRIEVAQCLAPAYAAVSQAVVRTGNAINAALSGSGA